MSTLFTRTAARSERRSRGGAGGVSPHTQESSRDRAYRYNPQIRRQETTDFFWNSLRASPQSPFGNKRDMVPSLDREIDPNNFDLLTKIERRCQREEQRRRKNTNSCSGVNKNSRSCSFATGDENARDEHVVISPHVDHLQVDRGKSSATSDLLLSNWKDFQSLPSHIQFRHPELQTAIRDMLLSQKQQEESICGKSQKSAENQMSTWSTSFGEASRTAQDHSPINNIDNIKGSTKYTSGKQDVVRRNIGLTSASADSIPLLHKNLDGINILQFEEEFAFSEYYMNYLNRRVFDRLSDPTYFGGAYREKYDDFGVGHGVQDLGTTTTHLYEGGSNCSRLADNNMHLRKIASSKKTCSYLERRDPKQHFETLKVIWVYRNGVTNEEGDRIFIKRNWTKLPILLQELRRQLRYPVRELYNQDLDKITHMRNLIDGGKYLACEGQGPTQHKRRLRNFLSNYTVWE